MIMKKGSKIFKMLMTRAFLTIHSLKVQCSLLLESNFPACLFAVSRQESIVVEADFFQNDCFGGTADHFELDAPLSATISRRVHQSAQRGRFANGKLPHLHLSRDEIYSRDGLPEPSRK